MTSDKLPFSQRYGVGPEKQPLEMSGLPFWIRGEFVHELKLHSRDAFQDDYRDALHHALRPLIWQTMNEKPSDSFLWNEIEEVFLKCPWGDFWEACERAVGLMHDQNRAIGLQDSMNSHFAHDLLAWRFEEGEVVLAQPPEITAIIEEVKGILADPRFAGPNEQFRKANGHLNEKPTPDTENCIKDAVGALEGVARIVMNQPKGLLSDLLKKGKLKSEIPQHLNSIMERVYVYRGNEDGVAHGKTTQKSIPIEDANFALSICAASIVYLGQKFPDSAG